MAGIGSSFSSATSQGGRQAGVGLLLAETEMSGVIVVKQVVPRGAADRSGRVRVGDQIMRVAGVDSQGLGVTDLKNMIVGEAGTRVPIRFRHSDTGEMFELELTRGAPEQFETHHAGGYPPVQGYGHPMMGYAQGQPLSQAPLGGSLYASAGRVNVNKYMLGTSWSAEMFQALPPPPAAPESDEG